MDLDTLTIVPPAVAVPTTTAVLRAALAARRADLDAALARLEERALEMSLIADCLTATLARGQKALVAGNGGSAAAAQHFVGELVGRFKRERRAFAALALTTDTAVLTAIGNDYGFADIFARQVAALGQPGDALIVFSTSGESENLLRAAEAARMADVTVIAITGERPSRLTQVADLTLRAPSTDTPLTQELHMIVTHLICEWIEARLADRDVEPV